MRPKCKKCGKFLSKHDANGENVYENGLYHCSRCDTLWNISEVDEAAVFDTPTTDGESNLQESEDRARRLKIIFEGRDNV